MLANSYGVHCSRLQELTASCLFWCPAWNPQSASIMASHESLASSQAHPLSTPSQEHPQQASIMAEASSLAHARMRDAVYADTSEHRDRVRDLFRTAPWVVRRGPLSWPERTRRWIQEAGNDFPRRLQVLLDGQRPVAMPDGTWIPRVKYDILLVEAGERPPPWPPTGQEFVLLDGKPIARHYLLRFAARAQMRPPPSASSLSQSGGDQPESVPSYMRSMQRYADATRRSQALEPYVPAEVVWKLLPEAERERLLEAARQPPPPYPAPKPVALPLSVLARQKIRFSLRRHDALLWSRGSAAHMTGDCVACPAMDQGETCELGHECPCCHWPGHIDPDRPSGGSEMLNREYAKALVKDFRRWPWLLDLFLLRERGTFFGQCIRDEIAKKSRS